MIFDHKSVHEITDEEIEALVRNHVHERQHLEFKATVNLRTDEEKHELLKDVASLANGGGGYLIIGIRDDSRGRAQTYASGLKLDGERVKRTVMNLCSTYISERIQGLEVLSRKVKSHPIVIVRVPSSYETPHMVTFNGTTGFYNRYHDGKRSMTIGEIRDAVSQYSLEDSQHDEKIFQQSDQILNEADMEIFMEELEDNSAYRHEDMQLISDFCDILEDEQNRYVHRNIRSTCESLTNSFEALLAFFRANYYGPFDKWGGSYHLSIYPESGVDLEVEELSDEDEQKWEQLHNRLLEITAAVGSSYDQYRRAVRKVLLL